MPRQAVSNSHLETGLRTPRALALRPEGSGGSRCGGGKCMDWEEEMCSVPSSTPDKLHDFGSVLSPLWAPVSPAIKKLIQVSSVKNLWFCTMRHSGAKPQPWRSDPPEGRVSCFHTGSPPSHPLFQLSFPLLLLSLPMKAYCSQRSRAPAICGAFQRAVRGLWVTQVSYSTRFWGKQDSPDASHC